MIRRLAIAAAVGMSLFAAAPARASGDISCVGDGVSIDMLVGRLQVLAILRATITMGEEKWSTDPGHEPGTAMTVGQAFEDDRIMLVDFMDDNVERVIGRLRVVNLEGISAGAFAFEGREPRIVDCSLRG